MLYEHFEYGTFTALLQLTDTLLLDGNGFFSEEKPCKFDNKAKHLQEGYTFVAHRAIPLYQKEFLIGGSYDPQRIKESVHPFSY